MSMATLSEEKISKDGEKSMSFQLVSGPFVQFIDRWLGNIDDSAILLHVTKLNIFSDYAGPVGPQHCSL